MKWLRLLLAVLVLALSLQPVCITPAAADTCCRTASCSDGPSGEEGPETGHQHCAGTCNPFQLCGCCVFGVLPPLAAYPAELLPDYRTLADYQLWTGSGQGQAHLPDCWQPPRNCLS